MIYIVQKDLRVHFENMSELTGKKIMMDLYTHVLVCIPDDLRGMKKNVSIFHL